MYHIRGISQQRVSKMGRRCKLGEVKVEVSKNRHPASTIFDFFPLFCR